MSIKNLPLWSKVTFIIFFGSIIGAYMSGESTRKLDSEYIIRDIRNATQLSTTLLANILSESVVVNDLDSSNSIIKQSVKHWPEVKYLHIENENGGYFTEWGKLDRSGFGIQKFEAPIIFGEQNYGVLCVFVDLGKVYSDMESHISEVRNRSALILLAVSLFIIGIVDLLITQKRD